MYRRSGVRVSFTRFVLGGIIRDEDREIMMADVSISGLPMVRFTNGYQGRTFSGRIGGNIGYSFFIQKWIVNYTSLNRCRDHCATCK
jgi:hypothetical protein